MTTFFVYEVIIPEHNKAYFEKLMEGHNYAFKDKKQFRVTNLESWIKNTQKSIDDLS